MRTSKIFISDRDLGSGVRASLIVLFSKTFSLKYKYRLKLLIVCNGNVLTVFRPSLDSPLGEWLSDSISRLNAASTAQSDFLWSYYNVCLPKMNSYSLSWYSLSIVFFLHVLKMRSLIDSEEEKNWNLRLDKS